MTQCNYCGHYHSGSAVCPLCGSILSDGDYGARNQTARSREGGGVMTQREQFEAWLELQPRIDNQERYWLFQAWQAAQSAKDAEIAELRANLAKCREYIEQVEQAKFKHVWVD